jgi:hypothetical protein
MRTNRMNGKKGSERDAKSIIQGESLGIRVFIPA